MDPQAAAANDVDTLIDQHPVSQLETRKLIRFRWRPMGGKPLSKTQRQLLGYFVQRYWVREANKSLLRVPVKRKLGTIADELKWEQTRTVSNALAVLVQYGLVSVLSDKGVVVHCGGMRDWELRPTRKEQARKRKEKWRAKQKKKQST